MLTGFTELAALEAANEERTEEARVTERHVPFEGSSTRRRLSSTQARWRSGPSLSTGSTVTDHEPSNRQASMSQLASFCRTTTPFVRFLAKALNLDL